MEATTKVWSEQQDAIFNWFRDGKNHLIVRARAGTGKTTTIIRAIDFASEQNIMLCAFNKKIAEELTIRLKNPRAQAKTLHAIGFACVRRYRDNLKIASGSERADALSEKVCGPQAPDVIRRLVSKLHTKGREIVPHAKSYNDLIDVAVNFECEPEEQWQNSMYNTEYVVERALEAMELASQVKSGESIDFADMIFLPVRNHWMHKQYDMVVVDEAQDMTNAQLEIAQGVCSGRIAIVGDDRQAIYGFRGADSESLDRLKKELNATELGLTTTYRCGKNIVNLAAMLVPDFAADENNQDGEILEIGMQSLVECAAPGDFIVSRVNAPLVHTAMGLLRSGKRARISGRDIGAGLKSLIRKLAKGRAANSVPEFLERVTIWEEREVMRQEKAKQPARVDMIKDQASMIRELSDNVKSVREIEERIDALFTDDGLGQLGVITCSSVHRVKGLEAERVFILASTLRDHNQEEKNIQYVAITRAKRSLVWVN